MAVTDATACADPCDAWHKRGATHVTQDTTATAARRPESYAGTDGTAGAILVMRYACDGEMA